MEKRCILNKEESLNYIRNWDFTPDENNRVKAIVLTMPRITESELCRMKQKYATRTDGDGDVIPGIAVLRVLSEAMARELILSNASKAVNRVSFMDASVL